MRLYYATHDGQTRLIAARVADRLTARGLPVGPVDLAQSFPTLEDLASTEAVILIGPVRYGHHLAPADRLLKLCRDLPESVKLVVASVNLTARKAGKDTPEGNPYLKKWLARHDSHPALAAAFAGRLDYPRYGWLDRQMIRLIMVMTGGPTDPTAQVEYTDWDKVDAFADDVAHLIASSTRPGE